MQADSFQHGSLRTLHMVSGPLSRAVKKENGRFSSSKGSSGACHFNKVKTPVANEERIKLIPCAALTSVRAFFSYRNLTTLKSGIMHPQPLLSRGLTWSKILFL